MKLILSSIVALSFLCLTMELQAQENHLFYNCIKDAYRDSNLNYNLKVERTLYSKRPKPQDSLDQSGLNAEIPTPKNKEEELIQRQTIEALYRQFFRNVKAGKQYYPISEIKKLYGMTPEARIGVSSGGYYRLFVAYWTLKAKLREYQETNIEKNGYANIYYVDNLLFFVESTLAGAFFPTPGPAQIPESLRRQGIQQMLNAFAPNMTIKELYEGADAQKARWPVLK